jgi:SHS2 domain-containing protein
MPYKFLEGLTMADIAFEATGATREEMFIAAANAMTATQLHDLREIKPKEKKELVLEAGDIERLLHDFLQELIFYKDAELLLFSNYELKISKMREGLKLTATLAGEKIDPKRHNLLVDVKAVSWHKFSVSEKDGAWTAIVIIDV